MNENVRVRLFPRQIPLEEMLEIAAHGQEALQALIERKPALKALLSAAHLRSVLPTKMTIGDRSYELLSPLKEGEEFVEHDVMVARATEMGAYVSLEETGYILKRQVEVFEGYGVIFGVPVWSAPKYPMYANFQHSYGGLCVPCPYWRKGICGCCRLLRREEV